MRSRRPLMVPLLLLALIAGCGDGSTSSAPDPADATSCADLAAKYAEITGNIIDQIGDRTDAEMESPPADLEAAADEWIEVVQELVPRTSELCDEGEYDDLLCDRNSDIEPVFRRICCPL